MKKISENIDTFGIPEIDEDYMIEMSNLRPNETGLPMVIWVQPNTGRLKHGPRIKVQTAHGHKASSDKFASVGFSRDGEVQNFGGLTHSDFELVKQFIAINLDLLINLWDDEISPMEFASQMKKV